MEGSEIASLKALTTDDTDVHRWGVADSVVEGSQPQMDTNEHRWGIADIGVAPSSSASGMQL